MRSVVRAGLTLAAVAVGVFGLATPAQAHSLRYGDDASNWVSRVTSVQPHGAVSAAIGDGVVRLTVTLRRAASVVIDGYQGESFVLLRRGGAWVNTRSSTWYAVHAPRATPPATVDDSAPPQWHRVANTASWSWHDTRTHWPGYTLPPPVEEHPDQRQHVFDWTVGLRVDGRPGSVEGTLDWVPGPGGGSGAVAATAGFAAVLGLALLIRRTVVIAGALGVLVAVDVVHSIGMVAGRVGDFGSRLAAMPGHGGLPLALWLLTAGTVYLLFRHRDFGLYAAAMLAALFCFTEALPSLGVLWHSQAVNALPLAANRVFVALLTGASVATALAAVAVIVRTSRSPIDGGTT
jgi:hypothetical protein